MSNSTADMHLGPHDPTCRRGVSIFPPTPRQLGRRRDPSDAVGLPTADDNFARPIENIAASRATRALARGPNHPKLVVPQSRTAVGLKPVELYATQDAHLLGHDGRVQANFFNDRINTSASIGSQRASGFIAGRILPDQLAGISFLSGAVGGQADMLGFGSLSGDIGIGREHLASDLGSRIDSSPDWYRRKRVRSKKGGKLQRHRSQSSVLQRTNRDIEIRDSVSYNISAAFTMPWVAKVGLIRLDKSSQNETRYVACVSNDEAWQALYEQSGMREIMRSFFSRDVRHQKRVVPTFQEPEKIAVGGKLTGLDIDSLQGTTFFGLPLALTGFQATRQQNKLISVRRATASSVDAAVSSMNFRGRRLMAGLFFGAQGSRGRYDVGMWSYGIGFDTSRPDALGVYNTFIAGTLPGAQTKQVQPTDWSPALAGRLGSRKLLDAAAFMNGYNQAGSGVLYKNVRQIDATYRRTGLALRSYFFPTYYLYPGMLTALSAERVRCEYRERGTDGKHAWRIHSFGREDVVERGLWGSQLVGTSALRFWRVEVAPFLTNRALPDNEKIETKPAGSMLFLTARYHASRNTAAAVNRAFIEPLNRNFRLQIKPFTYVRPDLERSIEVEAPITDTDADILSRRAPTLAEKFVFSGSTGLPMHVIDALIAALNKLMGQPELVKRHVQNFVDLHGMPGFGLVHQLLRRKRLDLGIATMSDHYQQTHKRAQTVIFRYRHPLDADTSLLQLRSRFVDITRSLREIEDGINIVRGDTLIAPVGRRDLQLALETDQMELRDCLAARDTDKPALCSRLSGAWYRRSRSKTFARHLSDPGSPYKGALNTAKAFAQLHPGPLTGSMAAAELRRRFANADKALPLLAQALSAARDNLLLSEEDRRDVCTELRQKIERMQATIACDVLTPEQRQQIRNTLNGVWWQRSADKRILQHLDQVEALQAHVTNGVPLDGIARAYGAMFAEAQAVTSAHASEVQANFSPRQLRARFGACEKVLRQLTAALGDVDSNRTLTPEQRLASRAQLNRVIADVRRCCVVDALSCDERRVLRKRFAAQWWNSSLDKRIIHALTGSQRYVDQAQAIRHAGVFASIDGARAYLKSYAQMDASLEAAIRHADTDPLLSARQAERDRDMLNEARDAMHVDLWNARAAAPDVFQAAYKRRWFFWGGSARIAAALSSVPKGHP